MTDRVISEELVREVTELAERVRDLGPRHGLKTTPTLAEALLLRLASLPVASVPETANWADCPFCKFEESSYGSQLAAPCVFHRRIEELAEDAAMLNRISYAHAYNIAEMCKAFGDPEAEDPVYLARMRMEELRGYEEDDAAPSAPMADIPGSAWPAEDEPDAPAPTNQEGGDLPSATVTTPNSSQCDQAPGSAERPGAAPEPIWRHRKRGTTYRILGEHELQCSEPVTEGTKLTVYVSTEDSRHAWARPSSEFYDGRFEILPPAPEADGEVCETCEGTGKLKFWEADRNGMRPVEADCQPCNGTGRLLAEPAQAQTPGQERLRRAAEVERIARVLHKASHPFANFDLERPECQQRMKEAAHVLATLTPASLDGDAVERAWQEHVKGVGKPLGWRPSFEAGWFAALAARKGLDGATPLSAEAMRERCAREIEEFSSVVSHGTFDDEEVNLMFQTYQHNLAAALRALPTTETEAG